MSDSIREQVVDGVVARLGTINIGDGYYDTPSVYRAVREVTQDHLPAVNVFDGREETESKYGSFVQTLSFTIESFRRASSNEFSTVGNEMIADIKRVLFSSDSTYSGLVETQDLLSSTIEYPDSSSDVVKVLVELSIRYTEARGNPFLQLPA